MPLAAVAGCDATAPRLAPPSGAIIELQSASGVRLACTPHCGDAAVTEIAATTITTLSPDLAWFCVSSNDLSASVTVRRPPASGLEAIAFISDGAINIDVIFDMDGLAATSGLAGGGAGPGGLELEVAAATSTGSAVAGRAAASGVPTSEPTPTKPAVVVAAAAASRRRSDGRCWEGSEQHHHGGRRSRRWRVRQ